MLTSYNPRTDSKIMDAVFVVGGSVYVRLVPPAVAFGEPWPEGQSAWFMAGVEEPLTLDSLLISTGARGGRITSVVRNGRPIFVKARR